MSVWIMWVCTSDEGIKAFQFMKQTGNKLGEPAATVCRLTVW
jgi:hypothetical protein